MPHVADNHLFNIPTADRMSNIIDLPTVWLTGYKTFVFVLAYAISMILLLLW